MATINLLQFAPIHSIFPISITSREVFYVVWHALIKLLKIFLASSLPFTAIFSGCIAIQAQNDELYFHSLQSLHHLQLRNGSYFHLVSDSPDDAYCSLSFALFR